MRTSRSLVLGFTVGLTLSVVSSCGPAPQPCGPSSCMGCCDENGECLAGTGLLACGAAGGACVACEANQACLAGACGLIDGGDYDANFPDRPDSSVNYDAGTFDGGPRPDGGSDAGGMDAGGMDAGRPDAGGMDAGGTDAGGMDAGGMDAGGMDAGGMDAGGMDAGAVDAGIDAGAPVSFMTDVQPIFDMRCGSCHSWSHTSTVNVSTGCGGAGSVFIKPFSLDDSRLYGKVAGAPACGSPMPLNGTPLNATELDLLARWILQGALDN